MAAAAGWGHFQPNDAQDLIRFPLSLDKVVVLGAGCHRQRMLDALLAYNCEQGHAHGKLWVLLRIHGVPLSSDGCYFSSLRINHRLTPQAAGLLMKGQYQPTIEHICRRALSLSPPILMLLPRRSSAF